MEEIKPLIIHEQGLRENNEDAFCHAKTQNGTHFFTVCDGVGGIHKGEVASDLACRAVAGYIQKNELSSSYEKYIDDMVKSVDAEFDSYISSDSDAYGMGTTLVLLILINKQAIAVHIGDSRIYHFRKNKIIFETRDHSLVNGLIDNGLITKEEIEHHPQKNVITRAIQGNVVKPSKAETHIISDIQSGDYFFLCSDGITEGVDSCKLAHILASEQSDEEKINEIKGRCKILSRDNYTALLIPVKTL